MPGDRPIPYAESIVPYLDSYRKILHIPSSSGSIEKLPARGTTMAAADLLGIGLDIGGCSEVERAYVYSHASADRAISSNLISLFFVASRTGNAAYTPVLTHGGSEAYTWPDEIQRAEFSSDPNIPLTVTALQAGNRGVATLPRWFLDLIRNPGPEGRWTCKVNHYLGSDAFPPNAFGRMPAPDPGEIAWDLAGHSDRIRGLFKETQVPVQSGSYALQVGGVTSYAGDGEVEFITVPRTRMSHWSEFTWRDDMQFVDGLWHWVEIIMQPPPRRRTPKRTISL